MTTREDVLELAEDCGMATAPAGNGYWSCFAEINAFYQRAYAAGQAEMRERAYRLVSGKWDNTSGLSKAKAIRTLPIEGEKE